MKNFMLFCLAIVLFSVGIILGAELNSISSEKELAEKAKKLDSLQDIVIKNVQSEQKQQVEDKVANILIDNTGAPVNEIIVSAVDGEIKVDYK